MRKENKDGAKLKISKLFKLAGKVLALPFVALYSLALVIDEIENGTFEERLNVQEASSALKTKNIKGFEGFIKTEQEEIDNEFYID